MNIITNIIAKLKSWFTSPEPAPPFTPPSRKDKLEITMPENLKTGKWTDLEYMSLKACLDIYETWQEIVDAKQRPLSQIIRRCYIRGERVDDPSYDRVRLSGVLVIKNPLEHYWETCEPLEGAMKAEAKEIALETEPVEHTSDEYSVPASAPPSTQTKDEPAPEPVSKEDENRLNAEQDAFNKATEILTPFIERCARHYKNHFKPKLATDGVTCSVVDLSGLIGESDGYRSVRLVVNLQHHGKKTQALIQFSSGSKSEMPDDVANFNYSLQSLTETPLGYDSSYKFYDPADAGHDNHQSHIENILADFFGGDHHLAE